MPAAGRIFLEVSYHSPSSCISPPSRAVSANKLPALLDALAKPGLGGLHVGAGGSRETRPAASAGARPQGNGDPPARTHPTGGRGQPRPRGECPPQGEPPARSPHTRKAPSPREGPTLSGISIPARRSPETGGTLHRHPIKPPRFRFRVILPRKYHCPGSLLVSPTTDYRTPPPSYDPDPGSSSGINLLTGKGCGKSLPVQEAGHVWARPGGGLGRTELTS